jgi:metallo-beta-lactamase class B
VMEPDAALIERGGLGDFAFGDKFPYPKAKVDRVLHPGEVLTLGATSMKAVHTPGHTKGSTTWTLHTVSGHDVLFNCSVSVPGYQLKNNPANPGIVDDYRRTFDTLDSLPCDVLLGAHGTFFHLKEKLVSHAWVDAAQCKQWKAGARKNFEEQLAKQ